MAVIVQVPDDATSRHVRRLIGRRSGVTVVIADADAETSKGGGASRVSDADRRIFVGSPPTGDRNISLLRQGIWAVVPADSDAINKLLKGYVDDIRAGLCPLLNEITRDHSEVEELIETVKRRSRTRAHKNTDNPLSERETEILQRISRGVTSLDIATEMGFQLQTVKNKVTVILTKTHARTRTHAVSIALTRGWISAP